MAAPIDSLVVGRVIGDVIDLFVPRATLSVQFGTKEVTNGCEIKPSIAAEPPTIHIPSLISDLFTVVMIDPDAPSPSEPTMRELLHWLVVNIPAGNDAWRGVEVMPYLAPQPAIGIHRYVMVVYKQRSPLYPPRQPPYGVDEARVGFNTRAFARHHGLGEPVAAVYFNSQKERTNRRRNY
ncbi:hypothetical protein EJB05_44947 [Eragrostis curvula]|uniref:Uncharacterized protein n=1 Tax=Eragrostis curvula TaxID=38414 RepID=A0A5J9TJ70_9POAL|nr:hypothetical protein EJB05_44940 [Eragrostis curvula]TVU11364.1 hypothetical protein EJB05_44947 [Eragrostis curvula]